MKYVICNIFGDEHFFDDHDDDHDGGDLYENE